MKLITHSIRKYPLVWFFASWFGVISLSIFTYREFDSRNNKTRSFAAKKQSKDITFEEWWGRRPERNETVSDVEKASRALDNLASDNDTLVEQSIFLFERMGENAVPLLTTRLTDKNADPRTRINAIYALGRLGKNGESAVPKLVKTLENMDSDERAVTLLALGKMHEKANNSVIVIKRFLTDDDAWVRRSAKEALKNINTIEAERAIEEHTLETSNSPSYSFE